MTVMARASAAPRRTLPFGGLLGLLGSVAVHGLLYAVLRWAGTMPGVDFEIALPSEVEFGMTEPAAPEPPPSSPPRAEPPRAPAEPAPLAEAPKPKPKPKPKPPDAGVAEAPADEAADRAALPAAERGQPLLSAYAPEGAQIALRLHMGRVRESALAAEVRSLFQAIVDFKMVLEGSGLDPLRDLERLYIATPDLRRANIVIAGQYVGDPDLPQRAVESLAAARGETATFRREGAIRVAPWLNRDETPRVLALIAPQQFAITRSEDLPRVLQVARALAARRAREATRRDPAEALLALDDGETLALSVEGARAFVRGNLRGVPERLEIQVRERAGGSFEVTAQGFFPDERAAEAAAAYWQSVRDRYAGNLLVAAIGLRGPIADTEIEAQDERIELRSHATREQARTVLGFVTNALIPPPAAEPPPTGNPTPGAESRPNGAAREGAPPAQVNRPDP